MIHEMRTYRLHPGKAPASLRFYEQNGLGIIRRYAKLIGCWTKESGTLSSVVFLWGQRTDQRAKLAQDKDWQAINTARRGLVEDSARSPMRFAPAPSPAPDSMSSASSRRARVTRCSRQAWRTRWWTTWRASCAASHATWWASFARARARDGRRWACPRATPPRR